MQIIMDRLARDEAAPLLAKLPIDFLRTAVATANVQPVIADLRYANNERSHFPMYRSLLSLC
jgi:hypothetical protein